MLTWKLLSKILNVKKIAQRTHRNVFLRFSKIDFFCVYSMEYDQTEVKYLINGSLLLEYTFVSPRDFCFDNLHENGETKSIVIICMTLPVSTGFKYMLVIYQTCIGKIMKFVLVVTKTTSGLLQVCRGCV